jgi:hypothetical protein
VIFLILGAIFAFLTILPRFQGSVKGIVYWKAIAGFESAKDYSQKIMSAGDFHIMEAKLEHCYELPTICSRKYRFISCAIWLASIGLSATILYLAIS